MLDYLKFGMQTFIGCSVLECIIKVNLEHYNVDYHKITHFLQSSALKNETITQTSEDIFTINSHTFEVKLTIFPHLMFPVLCYFSRPTHRLKKTYKEPCLSRLK